MGHWFPNKDDVYVDEEGRLKGKRTGFILKGSPHHYYVGNGLVVGRDGDESCDAKSTVLDVGKLVTFIGVRDEE